MYAMKSFSLFSILVASVSYVSASQDLYLFREFTDFVETYDRSYSSENEYHKRFDIFADNYLFIQDMNQRNHSFYLDVNEFSDMHHEEFFSMMNGFILNPTEHRPVMNLNPSSMHLPYHQN